MYSSQMFRYFKGSKLARMSDGSYCIIRDLGLVKGGKGMRHHEVLVTLSPGAIVRRMIKGKGLEFSTGKLARPLLWVWRQSSALLGKAWRSRLQSPSTNRSVLSSHFSRWRRRPATRL